MDDECFRVTQRVSTQNLGAVISRHPTDQNQCQGYRVECWSVLVSQGLSTGNLPAHMFVELGSQFSWVVGPPVFPTCGFLQQRRLTRKHTVHQTICTSSCFLHLRLVFWIAIKQQCLFIWATITKK